MAEPGVNVPHRGLLSIESATRLGARWVRVVIIPDMFPSSLLQQYRAAGLAVLAVLARESFVGGDYGRQTEAYVKMHGRDVDAWQIGNEPDHESPSSWTLAQDEYAQLLAAAAGAIRRVYPNTTIVGAGGASGDPNYFGRGDIREWLDAVACLVPDQRVTASNPTRAMMRAYEGDVVVIQTAGGNQVTCTPNHPILTRQGWLPAGEVHEGMDVAHHAGDNSATAGPHDVQVPTPIAEVLRSLQEVGLTYRRPITRLDFHGDGRDGDVDVVVPDRSLLSPDPEGGEQVVLVQPVMTPNRLPFGQPLSLARLRESVALGLAATADRQPSRLEQDVETGRLLSEFGSQGIQALAAQIASVQGNDVVIGQAVRRGGALVLDRPPSRPKLGSQPGRITMDARGNLSGSLAGQVTFMEVVKAERRWFGGHVYNLSTPDGWYAADGIIVHNCHPYGQDADTVPAPAGNFGKASDLIGRYADLGLPVWVTEYGCDDRNDGTPEQCAPYVGALTAQFKADPRVRVATHFCVHDGMVPGFGLLAEDGSLKLQGAAYRLAAQANGGTPVATVEERLAQLERQQSLQTMALAALLSDHYDDGAESAKSALVALNEPKYKSLKVVEKANLA